MQLAFISFISNVSEIVSKREIASVLVFPFI
jgi:hypothetical protein